MNNQLKPATYIFEGNIKIKSGLVIIKDEMDLIYDHDLSKTEALSLLQAGRVFSFLVKKPSEYGLKVKFAEKLLTIDGANFKNHLGRSDTAVITINSGKIAISDSQYVNDPSTHINTFFEKIASSLLSYPSLVSPSLFFIRVAKKINSNYFADRLPQKKLVSLVPPGNYAITVHSIINKQEFTSFIINLKKTLQSPIGNKIISKITEFE